MIKKLTKDEFIKKANIIHNNKYDYSKVIYKNNKTKIIIICPIHGEFLQRPSHHLRNQNCPKCNIVLSINNNFISKSILIHNNKYNYDKVIYKNNHTKVIIICYIHGEFLQTPKEHLRGSGCPKCFGHPKSNIEEFINKSNIIHNNKYDYSKFIYINNHTKGIIICPIHGEFLQTPCSHLRGRSCSKCNFSIGELKIERYLKENNIKFENQKRFKDCRDKLPLPFDFYILELNMCIEFDGRQHFSFDDTWGGEKEFILRQLHDKLKTEYCLNNNIKLFRIKYYELNNIKNIIKNLQEKSYKF